MYQSKSLCVGGLYSCCAFLPRRKKSRFKSLVRRGRCMGNVVIVRFVVYCMRGIRWRYSSCDAIYMWMRLMGVRGLFAICRICKYGVSSMGVAILVILQEKTIDLWIMVSGPPLLGAYCMYGLQRHVIASSVLL